MDVNHWSILYYMKGELTSNKEGFPPKLQRIVIVQTKEKKCVF